MSDEIRVNTSLQVVNGSEEFQSRPTAFFADQENPGGPTPGQLNVTTAGLNVDLSVLTYPGWMWLQNLSDTYLLEWGVHDGSIFHPIGELLPGEFIVTRLSRNLGQEEDVPGTGTTAVVNSLFLRGVGGTCKAICNVFER